MTAPFPFRALPRFGRNRSTGADAPEAPVDAHESAAPDGFESAASDVFDAVARTSENEQHHVASRTPVPDAPGTRTPHAGKVALAAAAAASAAAATSAAYASAHDHRGAPAGAPKDPLAPAGGESAGESSAPATDASADESSGASSGASSDEPSDTTSEATPTTMPLDDDATRAAAPSFTDAPSAEPLEAPDPSPFPDTSTTIAATSATTSATTSEPAPTSSIDVTATSARTAGPTPTAPGPNANARAASGTKATAAILDAGGRIASVGPQASLLWPQMDAASLVGRFFVQLFEGDSVAAAVVALSDARVNGVGRASIPVPDGVVEISTISDPGTDRIVVVATRVHTGDNQTTAVRGLLRHVASSLDAGVVAFDAQHRLTIINDDTCRLFGLGADPSSMAGTPTVLLYHSIARLTADAERTAQVLVDIETANVHAEATLELLDGQRLAAVFERPSDASIDSYWVFSPEGASTAVRSDGDVIRAELARVHERKSAMLYTASHEVRGTLHGILGLVEELREVAESPDVQSLIEPLSDACTGLRTMVQQVLDVAQLEAGALGTTARSFDLRDVLREVAAVVGGIITAKPVELAIRIDDDFHTGRLGDPVRVSQILTNVASNAAKSTQRGTVTISVSRHDRGVRFVVADTGPGMPEYAMTRLTAPLPAAAVRYGEHNRGLGLLIARELIELLGGHAEVSTAAGSGTEVAIDLPLPEVDMPGSNRFAEAPEPNVAIGSVLVVDDAPDALELLERNLSRVADHVDATADGDEALALAAVRNYEFIVLDGLMSPRDGADLTRAIRQLPSGAGPRIVIATANVGQVSTARYLAAGADAVLAKPFSGDELLGTIRRVRRALPGFGDAPSSGSAMPPGVSEDSHPALPPGLQVAMPVAVADVRPAPLAVEAAAPSDDAPMTPLVLDLESMGSELDHDERVATRRARELFASLLDQRMRAVRDAFAAGDVGAFCSAVHGLGSPAVVVGARQLGPLCLAMETTARAAGIAAIGSSAMDALDHVAKLDVAALLDGGALVDVATRPGVRTVY